MTTSPHVQIATVCLSAFPAGGDAGSWGKVQRSCTEHRVHNQWTLVIAAEVLSMYLPFVAQIIRDMFLMG